MRGFEFFDSNRDGNISTKELKETLSSQGSTDLKVWEELVQNFEVHRENIGNPEFRAAILKHSRK